MKNIRSHEDQALHRGLPFMRRRVVRGALGALAMTAVGGALAYAFVPPSTWTMWQYQAGYAATRTLLPGSAPTMLMNADSVARIQGFRAVLVARPPLVPHVREGVVSGLDAVCMDSFITNGEIHSETGTIEQRSQSVVTLHWPDGTTRTVQAGERGALSFTRVRNAVPDLRETPGTPNQVKVPWSLSCVTQVGLDAVPADLSGWKRVNVRARGNLGQ